MVLEVEGNNHRNKTMTSLNYDANKLPLGKLSDSTLKKGFQLLKDISAVLTDPSISMTKFRASQSQVLLRLTSDYYTVIPHDFGRKAPPVINSIAQLKLEAELIESLGEMEIAAELMDHVLPRLLLL